MPLVEVYGADWCPYSVRATLLLRRKGVPFRYLDVDQLDGAREEMRRRGGGHTIPQVFIDGVPFGGSDDLHALDASGRLDEVLRGDIGAVH